MLTVLCGFGGGCDGDVYGGNDDTMMTVVAVVMAKLVIYS